MAFVYVVTIHNYDDSVISSSSVVGVYVSPELGKQAVVETSGKILANLKEQNVESGTNIDYNIQHFPYGFSEIFMGDGEGMRDMVTLVKSTEYPVHGSW